MEAGGRSLPQGRVTFLFTDIEDSTLLLRELGSDRYVVALDAHRRAIREAVERHDGVEVDTQGDAFFVAFADASAAVAAALDAQQALSSGAVLVRMGLHTGTPAVGTEGYVGEDVHLGARIAAAGHGGQVLISNTTRADCSAQLVDLVDLGEHRVKGFAESVWIWQVGSGTHPPLRTISNTNVPQPASNFIGREAELTGITALLTRGARLVTLTGPGGTGKTRLANEVALGLVPQFKAGVFWVRLSTVVDAQLVTQTIAAVIGAKHDLAEDIGERQMLLVLDNFEQVVEASQAIGQLLERCRALQVLVTSRELLRINGEVEFAVPVLATGEAVQLFCDRSALVADTTIEGLCRRLEGLPLAIELAAARTRVMSPAQISDRLGTRLDMLKGGRDVDARQQTLRATIQWSYDLLDPDEQRLLRAISIFRGGCTLDAAEQVADADIDLLQSLADKSLVRRVDDRFRMLETIREFGVERLADSGDEAAVAGRHADFFTQLAVESEKHIVGNEQEAWWQRLTDEIDNLRAALSWAATGGDPAVGLRLSAAMWRYWWQRGLYAEGRRAYEAALNRDRDQPRELIAHASRGLANMLLGLGETDAALEILEDCLPIFRDASDYSGTVSTLTDLGIGYTNAGLYPKARVVLEEALAATRAAGDVRRAGVTLINLGDLAIVEGDLPRAAQLLEPAIESMLQVGDRQSAANARGTYAMVESMRGNVAHAAALYPEALRGAQQTGDLYTILHCWVGVAALFNQVEDRTQAARFLGCIEALQHQMEIAINATEQKLMDETMTDVRERLSPREFEILLAEGRAMSFDTAQETVMQALDQLEARR